MGTDIYIYTHTQTHTFIPREKIQHKECETHFMQYVLIHIFSVNKEKPFLLHIPRGKGIIAEYLSSAFQHYN